MTMSQTDGSKKTCKVDQHNAGIFPEMITNGSNQEAHFRQISFVSNFSEEGVYDRYAPVEEMLL